MLSDMSAQIQQSRAVEKRPVEYHWPIHEYEHDPYDHDRGDGCDGDDDSVHRGGLSGFDARGGNEDTDGKPTSLSDNIFESQLLEAVCSQL